MATSLRSKQEIFDSERKFIVDLFGSCEKDDLAHVKQLAHHLFSTSGGGSVTDYRDGQRAGAIHAACRGGAIHVLTYLLSLVPEQGAEKDGEGRTPLTTCCMSTKPEAAACIRFLLSTNKYARESVFEPMSTGGRTQAVHLASSLNSAANLLAILETMGSEMALQLTTASSSSGTPLHWAAAHADTPETIQTLIRFNPTLDVNASTGGEGTYQSPTPLLLALMRGKVELARALTVSQIPLCWDYFVHNLSPLAAACVSGSMECVEFMQHQCADFHALCMARDPMEGLRPIEVAAHAQQEAIVVKLAPFSGPEFASRELSQWMASLAVRAEQDHKKAEEQQNQARALGMAAKEKGNQAFAQGDYLRAGEIYQQAISSIPQLPADVCCLLLCNASASWFKLGQFERACEAAQHAVETDRTHVKAYLRLGAAEGEKKDHEAAARAYWAGYEVDKKGPLATFLLAKFNEEIKLAQAEYKSKVLVQQQ